MSLGLLFTQRKALEVLVVAIIDPSLLLPPPFLLLLLLLHPYTSFSVCTYYPCLSRKLGSSPVSE